MKSPVDHHPPRDGVREGGDVKDEKKLIRLMNACALTEAGAEILNRVDGLTFVDSFLKFTFVSEAVRNRRQFASPW